MNNLSIHSFVKWFLLVKPRAGASRYTGQMLAGLLINIILIHFISLLSLLRGGTFASLYPNLFVILAVSEIFFLGLWWLNRQGFTALATQFSLVLMVAAMSLVPQQYPILAYAAYILPPILASFMLGPAYSFLYASISSAGFVVSMLGLTSDPVYYLLGVFIIFSIAFLSWFIASRLRDSARRLEVLHSIDQAILTLQSSESVGSVVLEYLRSLIPFQYASIITHDSLTQQTNRLAFKRAGGSLSKAGDAKDNFTEQQFEAMCQQGMERIIRIEPGRVSGDPILQSEGNRSSISMPLVITETLKGTLNLGWLGGALSADRVEIVEEVASQLSIAIRQAQLYEASQQQARELSMLLNVSNTLASTLELDTVLQISIESAVHALELDTGAIYVVDGDSLYLGATTPSLDPNMPDEFRRASIHDHPHIREAISLRQPIDLPDTQTAVLSPAEQVIVQMRGLRTILYVPLLTAEQAVGVLILGTLHNKREFSQADFNLSNTMSNQIAMTVTNAHLYRSMRRANLELTKAYTATIEGWSKALDLRDQETNNHTLRVADLTVEFARALMQPSEEELLHIYRGALLHDIGKIGVPDHILLKPASLNDEELAVMRMHPTYGYELLRSIDYLQPALDIPYCHHEKWDGTGYPRGLKGAEIPFVARIFAIVDVYDALTSDRPYRSRWTKQAALDYIRSQSGRHFEPAIVAHFLKSIEKV